MEQKTRQWKRTRKMVIPMDEVEYDRLMDLANRTGLSMSECVRRAVSRVEPDVVAMTERELAGVRESRPEAPQTFAGLHDDTAAPVDNERSAVEKCPEAVDK